MKFALCIALFIMSIHSASLYASQAHNTLLLQGVTGRPFAITYQEADLSLLLSSLINTMYPRHRDRNLIGLPYIKEKELEILVKHLKYPSLPLNELIQGLSEEEIKDLKYALDFLQVSSPIRSALSRMLI